MRSNLAESLFAAYVFRIDPILAAGAWPDGTPLSGSDVAWIRGLGASLRLALFEELPAWRPTPDMVAPPAESELRAMHGDR